MVITGLIRNQFDGNVTWVRIPHPPPVGLLRIQEARYFSGGRRAYMENAERIKNRLIAARMLLIFTFAGSQKLIWNIIGIWYNN